MWKGVSIVAALADWVRSWPKLRNFDKLGLVHKTCKRQVFFKFKKKHQLFLCYLLEITLVFAEIVNRFFALNNAHAPTRKRKFITIICIYREDAIAPITQELTSTAIIFESRVLRYWKNIFLVTKIESVCVCLKFQYTCDGLFFIFEDLQITSLCCWR